MKVVLTALLASTLVFCTAEPPTEDSSDPVPVEDNSDNNDDDDAPAPVPAAVPVEAPSPVGTVYLCSCESGAETKCPGTPDKMFGGDIGHCISIDTATPCMDLTPQFDMKCGPTMVYAKFVGSSKESGMVEFYENDACTTALTGMTAWTIPAAQACPASANVNFRAVPGGVQPVSFKIAFGATTAAQRTAVEDLVTGRFDNIAGLAKNYTWDEVSATDHTLMVTVAAAAEAPAAATAATPIPAAAALTAANAIHADLSATTANEFKTSISSAAGSPGLATTPEQATKPVPPAPVEIAPVPVVAEPVPVVAEPVPVVAEPVPAGPSIGAVYLCTCASGAVSQCPASASTFGGAADFCITFDGDSACADVSSQVTACGNVYVKWVGLTREAGTLKFYSDATCATVLPDRDTQFPAGKGCSPAPFNMRAVPGGVQAVSMDITFAQALTDPQKTAVQTKINGEFTEPVFYAWSVASRRQTDNKVGITVAAAADASGGSSSSPSTAALTAATNIQTSLAAGTNPLALAINGAAGSAGTATAPVQAAAPVPGAPVADDDGGGGSIVVVIIIVVVLLLIGLVAGGVAYWWFKIRKAPKVSPKEKKGEEVKVVDVDDSTNV